MPTTTSYKQGPPARAVLATLEHALVIKSLGKLSQRDQQALRETIGKIIG